MATFTKFIALAGLAVAATAANAATFVFDFSSVGTFTRAAGLYSVNDTVLPGAGADFSTLPVAAVSYTYLDLPATAGSGVITLANASTIDFSFSGSIIPNGNSSNALNGLVVNFNNGTGSLAGITGTGSISNTIRWDAPSFGNAGNSRTTFYAELDAVPEPASMAAIAVGLVALARKRRK